MAKPTISVIIPLYNKEQVVNNTIQSVLNQSFTNFELIVVNDGSTDNSVEVVKSIKDERITIVNQENGGPGKARNTGVAHSHGEWILFVDADDELLPDALFNYYLTISEIKDTSFVACPFYFNNSQGNKLRYPYKSGWLKNPFKAFFMGTFFTCTGSFICKKELLVSHPFNESIRRYEDIDVWFQIYREAKIHLIDKPVLVVNHMYANASKSRINIQEDFIGHLDFKGKSFWEFMCLYKLYLMERPNYKGQIDHFYPYLKYRYDLLILYKLISYLKL